MDNFYTSRMHGFPTNFSSHAGVVGVAIAAETAATATRGEGVASLIVVLGSSLSLVGLVFAFITYSLFSDLRSLSGTTLMNLLAGLFMAQLLYVIGVGGVQDPDLCSALSLSLQYVRLTVLCWLTASAHHMHATFRDGVVVRSWPVAREGRLSASFLRYSLFGWGAPLLCLAASAILQAAHDASLGPSHPHHRNRMLYRRRHYPHLPDGIHHHEALILGTKVLLPSKSQLDHFSHHNASSILGSSFLSNDVAAAEGDCWFPEGTWSFGLGFLAPAIALLVADAVLLIKSAILVRYTSAMLVDRKVSEKMKAKRRLQVCLFARVSLLIGGVTALGAAARLSTYAHHDADPSPQHHSTTASSHHDPVEATSSLAGGSSAIWLAFDVANALQGIVVALCVTCDCGVLRLYTRSLRKGSGKRRGSKSSWGRKGRRKGPGGAQHHPKKLSKSTSLQLLTWDPTPDTV
ncbi:uncharacterized protein LOC124163930 [Ischnura elegans]|uniref:uncharacterized protein LOC124163930 n=1 Tax=Ischnura elegans TaxID=197161 RepID=UPI001ED87BEA|nr:uncharacterized protein LOC124163930 [Ischnura elegans]